MASRKLLCNVCNQDVIALSPEVTVACKVYQKRVHLTCSKQLLNDCLDAQASSVDAYECLSCNSIKGYLAPNFSRQDERCLDANLMPDEPNRYERFFNNCNYYDIETLNKYCAKSKSNGLSLMHFNVRSLQKNLNPLLQYLLQLKRRPDINTITETKLRENHIRSNVEIKGFTFIHKDSSSLAGGVGLYVKDSIKFNECNNSNINADEVENLWIEIANVGTPLITLANKKIFFFERHRYFNGFRVILGR